MSDRDKKPSPKGNEANDLAFVRGAGSVAGGAMLGAAIGGPVGAFVGAGIGFFLGQQANRANRGNKQDQPRV